MKYLYIVALQIIFIFPVLSKTKTNNSFGTESKFIHDVCITPSGKVLVCTDNQNVKAFDIKTKKLLAEFTNGHSGKVLTVDISTDSTMIASGGRDSTVVIWDTKTHTVMERISFTKGKICSVRFSPDSKILAIGCSNAKAYLYSIIDKKCIHVFDNQQQEFVEIAYNTYGNLLAITGANKTINIYNTSNYNKTLMLAGHKNVIRSLAFYDYGNAIFSCGDDGNAIQWKISSNKQLRKEKFSIRNGWNLCLDVENIGNNKFNMYTIGTIRGNIVVKTLFASYSVNLKCPINQIKIIPRSDGYIELLAATLGEGLLFIQAKQMKFKGN